MEDLFRFPDAITVGVVVYPPGGTLGPRVQTNLQLVFMHSGAGLVWIDGVPHPLPPHSVTLLLPNHREQFAFDTTQNTEHSWLHIPAETVARALLDRLAGLPRTLPLSDAMSALIRAALRFSKTTYVTTPALLKGAAIQMIALYLGEAEIAAGSQPPLPPRGTLHAARDFIHHHYTDALTLTAIANAAAVSETHLIRLFQQHLDTTPMAYVWEQRVWAGVELLRRTGLSVGEIAARVGFKTSYHFSRRVRQATGRSPLEVRRRAWHQHDEN